MIGLAFFLIGAAIAAGFIVLGWKMACKAQEQDEKKKPKMTSGRFRKRPARAERYRHMKKSKRRNASPRSAALILLHYFCCSATIITCVAL